MREDRLNNIGPINEYYLSRINETLVGALAIHPRLSVVRVDLRLPDNGCYSDNPLDRDTPSFFANTGLDLIKRFMASLKAQFEAERRAKAKRGERVHPSQIHHVWAREHSQDHKSHYHIALMLNKDRFYNLGAYGEKGYLNWMLIKAWASALGLLPEECATLVHFPKNAVYKLNRNAKKEDFLDQLQAVRVRLSYLAKEETKIRSMGQRCFGCSNPKKKMDGTPLSVW